MYYYASRIDSKSGSRLLTSYTNAKSQQKYGVGEELRLFSGLALLDTETGKFRETSESEYDPAEELLVRSWIRGNGSGSNSGKLQIMKKDGENWVDTPFKGDSYGALNTIMKSLASAMGGEYVIVERNYTPRAARSDDEESPF